MRFFTLILLALPILGVVLSGLWLVLLLIAVVMAANGTFDFGLRKFSLEITF